MIPKALQESRALRAFLLGIWSLHFYIWPMLLLQGKPNAIDRWESHASMIIAPTGFAICMVIALYDVIRTLLRRRA